MSDEAHPGQDAAGADNPWAPPEEKVSMGKPPAGQSWTGGPPVGGPPPSFHDQLTTGGTGPVAGGFAPPGFGPVDGGSVPTGAPTAGPSGGDEQGFLVPPPPIAPTDPGAAPYAAPGGYGYPAPAGYGYPTPPGYAGYGWPDMPMPRNGFGVAALVLGILSVCLLCMYGVVSVILGILAVVFGVKGRKRADRGEADNRGQAQAGFVLGIVGIALGVAVAVLMILGIVFAINDSDSGSDSSEVGNAIGASAPVLFHG
ncbi:DUF4190 domain-containing protein [Streptomyces sp. NPDC001020]